MSNAEKALELTLKQSNVSLADDLTDKLDVYRAGKPFREKPRGK
ncbi:MAG TPA: hypothetical protein VGH32_00360 [Pirellulales bacterium]